jgi:hypothetical protein
LELIPCEEGYVLPPRGGGLVGELFWVLVPSKVEPSKYELKQLNLLVCVLVELTCHSNWGYHPILEGGFLSV